MITQAAEGIGLENRQVGDGAGVRIPHHPPLFIARLAQLARALGSYPKGRWFKSCTWYHYYLV